MMMLLLLLLLLLTRRVRLTDSGVARPRQDQHNDAQAPILGSQGASDLVLRLLGPDVFLSRRGGRPGIPAGFSKTQVFAARPVGGRASRC